MLKNKKIRLILSLVVAILLWTYVIGEVNPSSDTKVKDVPINLTHLDMLGERGLAVSSVSAEYVDLELTGSRGDLSNLDVNDIAASVDMSAATKGTNEMTINIRTPNGITVKSKSLSRINVTVEPLTTKTVDVRILYNGTFPENAEGTTVKISSPTVVVSGAESLVDLVAYAAGMIDASRVTADQADISCELTPVTKDGKAVNNISISQRDVTVTSILSEKKTVKLTVPLTDTSSDDAKRTTKVPDTVIISGRADDLKGITAITADTVDISNITESTQLPLTFSKLPDGVRLSNTNTDLFLTLTVVKQNEQVFTYGGEEITLKGKKADFSYSLPGDFKVTVTVRGTPDALFTVKKENLTPSVDVSAFTEKGVQEALITANAPSADVRVVVSPERVAVTVSDKE